MTKYLLIISCVFFIYYPAISQEYLLDSLSTYSIFYTSEGPNETRKNTKFKYDSDKRLTSKTNGATYEVYTYSDEKNTIEDYLKATDELRFRKIEYFDDLGLVKLKTEEVLSNGEKVITKVDSFIRNEADLLIKLDQYELYNGELRKSKETQYTWSNDGRIILEKQDLYKNGTIIYDYIFYVDHIDYQYEEDQLKEKLRIRYDENGSIKECWKTTYTYFNDHFIEEVNLSEGGNCDLYAIWTKAYSYYSNSAFYEFDSLLIYGFQDVGWGLYRETRTKEYVFGEDIIVAYEGESHTAPFPEFEGEYFYKKASTVLNDDSEMSTLDVLLKPNILPINGLITIQTDEVSDLQINMFNWHGALVYNEEFLGNSPIQIVAPNTKGIYFMKVTNKNNRRFSIKKLIVQ